MIAVSEAVFGIKRRSDIEYFQECLWIEITVSDDRNLLIGNHYFSPDWLNFLENLLDTFNCVLLHGDFNVPGVDWNYGFPSPNCHFYTKLKEDLIHSAICFLGLNQHNYPDSGNTLTDLVFFSSNFADLSVDHAEYSLVQPDHFQPFFYH